MELLIALFITAISYLFAPCLFISLLHGRQIRKRTALALVVSNSILVGLIYIAFRSLNGIPNTNPTPSVLWGCVNWRLIKPCILPDDLKNVPLETPPAPSPEAAPSPASPDPVQDMLPPSGHRVKVRVASQIIGGTTPVAAASKPAEAKQTALPSTSLSAQLRRWKLLSAALAVALCLTGAYALLSRPNMDDYVPRTDFLLLKTMAYRHAKGLDRFSLLTCVLTPTGSRYHRLDCPHIANTPTANLTFVPQRDAKSKGYLPCSTCNPNSVTPSRRELDWFFEKLAESDPALDK